jgi:ankyrin repeat protein
MSKMSEIKLKSYTLKIYNYGPRDIFHIPDPKIKYNCSNDIRSKGFDYIHKIVMLTERRPEALSVLKDYLELYPEKINCRNKKGWTPLHLACRNSRTESTEETVELLLSYSSQEHRRCSLQDEQSSSNINVNLEDDEGCTALHMACKYSNEDSTERTVALLLGHPDINFDSQTIYGETSLSYACLNSNTNSSERTIELLLDHPNINVNLPTECDEAPLHMACLFSGRNSTVRTVELLVGHPTIDINFQVDGETALHLACWNSNTDSIERTFRTLLAHPKINVNLQNNVGQTPLHLACEKNKIKIVEMLLCKTI